MEHIQLLRADLLAANYRAEAINELLGPAASQSLLQGLTAPAKFALADNHSPLALLIRLFRLGQTLSESDLALALPQLNPQQLNQLGLLEAAGANAWRASVQLEALPGPNPAWVLADFSASITGEQLASEHVLASGGATRSLLQWTSRRPAQNALDLGTGCGIQAFALANHCEKVTATDISERALHLTRFGADLSHLNLQLKNGDMFAPLGEQQFDLIAANPPFVITPEQLRAGGMLRYRDGGASGDQISRRFVTEVPRYLRPGGRAFALINWIVRRGQTWQDPIQSWLNQTEIGAWVLMRQLQTPAQYAHTWMVDAGHHPGAPGYEAGVAAYLEYFSRENTEAIALAYLTFHAGAKLQLIEDARTLAQPTAATADSFWDALTHLENLDLSEFLQGRYEKDPQLIEQRQYVPGAADPNLIYLVQTGGLARMTQVDTVTAACVGACDGQLTLSQILAAVAQITASPLPQVIAQSEPILRQLVLQGFLRPVDRPALTHNSNADNF